MPVDAKQINSRANAIPSVPSTSVWDTLAQIVSPIGDRPCVVSGVEATHNTTRAGAPYVVIRNPTANTYLKLDPREHELMKLMDGTRSIQELVIAYFVQHGVLALSRITGLVQLLRTHHFLTEPPIDFYAQLGARLRGRSVTSLVQRFMQAFFFTEFPLRNVDARLGAWYRGWGWWFFTRPMVGVGLALALCGPVFYFRELGRDRYELFQVGDSYFLGMVLLAVLQSITLVIHELGHALAVKHAGRTVLRSGLLIYYGMPAGYVDTTDVWMAPRRKRLITTLAGPWTGLVLGGLCGVVSFLLPQGAVGSFLFAWGFVLLLNNLFNFNPLLQLDGYYLLVDLVEKPMLRPRALAFVRGPLWSKLFRRERLTGEERFFALFGLASLGYSVFALFLALRFWQERVGGWLNEAWASGNLFAQVIALFLGGLIVVPLAIGLWSVMRQSLVSIRQRVGWLSKRATEYRHRKAMEALRAVPLWANLSPAQLIEIARAMRAEQFDAGLSIVRQGEPGDRFYLIAEGACEVLENGNSIRRLTTGDYFGERALLAGRGAPRTATVLAVESTRVFSLDYGTFRATLAHDLTMRARLEQAIAYRAAVADIPLFRDIAPTELDLLLTRLEPQSFAPGETIIREGEPGDRFYILRVGNVQVTREGQVLRTMGPCETFGEIALVRDMPRTATVRAITRTELLALSASDFHDVLARYCGRASELDRLSHLRLQG